MKPILLLIFISLLGVHSAQNKISVSRLPFDEGGSNQPFSNKFLSLDGGVQYLNVFSKNANSKMISLVYGVTFSYPFHWGRGGNSGENIYFIYQPNTKWLNNLNDEYFISGYQFGLDILGHTFFENYNNFNLVVNPGIGFGRKSVIKVFNKEELSKYNNPYFLATLTLEPQIIIKKVKIGIKTISQYDFSNTKWKHKRGDTETFGTFQATGINVFLSVGFRI